MRRGEVWLAHFDPAQGSEAAKTRPCVVVSADASNRVVERLARGVITVVPITSNIARVYDFQALLPASPLTGLSADSKAQAEQVRALDHTRFTRKLGVLDAEQIAALDAALLVHLALWGRS
ncbi:MAG: type II toxin-antitoxin system PemK/MazF family toxin [Propionibacteriaceae bacterium]|jgi:mRNA interferase MazF|nr:type II toxin-antitoxin system PemK/MazF family toxin [Propionibacteriaceae bacterium]